jgi:predicted nucleotidyltransferase
MISARDAGVEDVNGVRLVRDHTILSAVLGSKAYGLATDASDTDVRGVYVAPTSLFWSLAKPPMHVDGPEPEQVSWEVERFCELALKGNPNALEVLWSPLAQVRTSVGDELLALREAFLSQLVHQTCSGYAHSQHKKLESDIRLRGAPRWKHAMHLLRLLIAGCALLTDGRPQLDVAAHREELLAVRRGELSWADVERRRLRLHAQLDRALEHTPLPAAPDVAGVDAWLHSVRERSARGVLP